MRRYSDLRFVWWLVCELGVLVFAGTLLARIRRRKRATRSPYLDWLPAGSKIVVGKTGFGKTTLAEALAGARDKPYVWGGPEGFPLGAPNVWGPGQ